MSFDWINKSYNVNAAYGRRIIVDGEPGIIVGASCAHLKIVFDKDKPNEYSYCHPTWRVEYQDIGEVRALTAGQKRYQEYLNADVDCSFAEWLGIDKKTKAFKAMMQGMNLV